MNKGLIAALIALGMTSIFLYTLESAPVAQVSSFEQYKKQFNKRYTREGEDQYRCSIFLKNVKTIMEHNANPKNTYTMGINQFTDFTQAELAATYLNLQAPEKQISTVAVNANGPVPNNVIDWVAAGKVTPVKNQGNCGAHWIFSTTAAMESAQLVQGGSTLDLSEQQLLDCSPYTYGCGQGSVSVALIYAKNNGLTTEAAYQYTSKQSTCKINSGPYKVSTYSYVNQDCSSVKIALAGRPLIVLIDGSNIFPYTGGIFNNCNTTPNFGMLLVGVTDTYWTLKNDMSTYWGESGYIRLAAGNTCGVCDNAINVVV